MPSVGTQFVIYAFSGSDSHFCHSASALGRATKYFEELTLRNLVPATAGDLSNGRTAAAGNQQQLEPLLPILATSNMTAKRLATRLCKRGLRLAKSSICPSSAPADHLLRDPRFGRLESLGQDVVLHPAPGCGI